MAEKVSAWDNSEIALLAIISVAALRHSLRSLVMICIAAFPTSPAGQHDRLEPV